MTIWCQAMRRLLQVQRQIQACPTSADHALPNSSTVCVTGAAGFVGGWLVLKLLERGHTVRACVRDASDDAKTGFIKKLLPEFGKRLSLHSADMTKEGAYDAIFEGVHTVFHPAEVFMSFGSGRDPVRAKNDSGMDKVSLDNMHGHATSSASNVAASINRSSTVRRLVYTASIASMMPSRMSDYFLRPAVDEESEPDASVAGAASYGITKRETEHFFSLAAASSGGKWSVVIGNPGDIIGPVLSAHQAVETWQGKIASIVQGKPVAQEAGGRPWMIVDVRDVAEAEIRLAESPTVQSGSRFLLASMDKIAPEAIGSSVNHLYPQYRCATTVTGSGKGGTLVRSHPIWLRAHLRNDRIRSAVGMQFRSFDDTLRATVDSLVSVGGVQPRTVK